MSEETFYKKAETLASEAFDELVKNGRVDEAKALLGIPPTLPKIRDLIKPKTRSWWIRILDQTKF